MTQWSDDEALMAALKEAVAEAQAVPASMREAARAAYTWRTIDEELLELTHDSALAGAAQVRSAADEVRVLSFTGEDVSLELEVEGGRVMGQVLPARAASIVLQAASGESVATDADASGFFTYDDVPRGLVRFSVTVEGKTSLTQWAEL